MSKEEYRCQHCNELFDCAEDRDTHQSLCFVAGKYTEVRMYAVYLEPNKDGSFDTKAYSWLEPDCFVDSVTKHCDSCYGYGVLLDKVELDFCEHLEPFAFLATLDLDKTHSAGFIYQCVEALADHLDKYYTIIKAQKESLGGLDVRAEVEQVDPWGGKAE